MNATLSRLSGLLVPAILISTAASVSPAAVTPAAAAASIGTCAHALVRGRATCFLVMSSEHSGVVRPATSHNVQTGWNPAQLQSAYNLTTAAANDGTGERVYIDVAYHDSTAAADLAAYRSQYGLPACTVANGCFQQLNQEGQTSPLPGGSPQNDDWSTEEALQIEMVSAICPNCGITVMEANDDQDNGLLVAIKEATDLGAKFVSIPWGGPEESDSTTDDSTYFESSGVVYTAAAGDQGYAGAVYPASSPDVISVGGTTLQTAGNARGWSETVWSGTGSGCSTRETKPSWQSGLPSGVCGGRVANDVSAVADQATGVEIYSGGFEVVGGTTTGTPIIAAAYALAGVPAPTSHPASFPYLHPTAFNDVTSGHDYSGSEPAACVSAPLLCTAAIGWDGPSGIGTPNGVSGLRGPDAASLTAGHATKITEGKSATLTTTLTDSTTHDDIGSADIQLLARPAGSHSFGAPKSATTLSNGKASVTVAPKKDTSYEWRYAGTAAIASATSKTESVDVSPLVGIAAKPGKPKHGKSFELFGTVSPGKSGQQVIVERHVGHSWKTVGKVKLQRQKLPSGKITLGYVLATMDAKKGKYSYRAVAAGTSANSAGTSKPVSVKVR